MMKLLYGHGQTVVDFCSKLIEPVDRGFGPCTAFGVVDGGGRLVAGIVYHNWCPEAGVIELSAASTTKRWLTRDVLRAIFNYPFDQLKCQMVVTRQPPEPDAIRRIWKACGATEHVIPRLRGRDQAEVIITLTDNAWASNRIARRIHGKENT